MIVAARHDSNQQIARARHGVDLEDLWNRSQVGDDTIVRALRDGQRREGEHAQPSRGRVDVGTVSNDHLPLLESAQAGEHSSACTVEDAGQIRHGRMGCGTQPADEAAIERIER